MNDLASDNPLMTGLGGAQIAPPCTLVILGAGGDLTRRKLLPALYNLSFDGALPSNFLVVGMARQAMDEQAFREHIRDNLNRYSRRPVVETYWNDLAKGLFYFEGALDELATYHALKARLEALEPQFGIPANRIFYLAVPPSLFEVCVRNLHAAGLARAPNEGPFSRVIVEKPIGHDLASARHLNGALRQYFDERQLFRIDHYLGKETVQNILVMRFANSIFEPIWNSHHIDHVQITVAEQEGVGTRAGYYEQAGALRDMVQNHILQLLSLIAMEPPWAMQADVIRDHRRDALNCLRPYTPEAVQTHVVRAQYGPGYVKGEAVPGYRREQGVAPDSTTETFVALKLFVDNWRWAGVPFYLRTAKRLPKRASEIAIQFKPVPPILFNQVQENPLEPNVLALSIQPNEGVSLKISTKLPGPRARVYPVKMDFRYGTTFGEQQPEAYERLLLDVMINDATLFMRSEDIEASWHWIQHILDAWEGSRARWLPEYAAGTWGPVEAERMIEADHRQWRIL